MATKCVPVHSECPDVDTQKAEIHELLQTRYKIGDVWYLVDLRWVMQWKTFVGYDNWDQSQRGLEEAHPGPVANTKLFDENEDRLSIARLDGESLQTADEVSIFEFFNQRVLKEHLMDERDYLSLPAQAWDKLVEWYGMTAGSTPISRVVVEYGLYMKHLKIEVYPLEFKLCDHPHLSNITRLKFSRRHTARFLERVIRATFSISEEMECRMWHRYMTHTYELLTEPNQTLQDYGLHNGQLIVIEKRNANGTWQRVQTKTPQQKQQAPGPPKTFSEVMMALRGSNKQAIETKGSLLSPTAASVKQRKKPKEVPSIKAQQEENNIVQQSESTDRQSDEYRLTIAHLEKTNSELNRSVHEKQDRITELEQEATTVQHQLVEAQGQLTEARREASQSRSQLTATRQEANQAQRQLADVRQEASRSRSQLTATRQEANQAQRQLANVRQEASRSRSQLTEARQEANQAQRQLAETQHQLAEAQHQAEEAHQRTDDIEHDLRDAEHRLTTSDRVFQDVLQRIMGHVPQSQPFWVVQRAEVTLTDEEIGTGGWASVKVAIFRGQRVAAKCLHPQIVSAHNIRLFTREMNMAAQARHPNLLQFIGAVMEGTPIILTELLPTSLRHIMEQGTRLTRQQIVSISCDVARALNYLHLSTPDPIVHRDLSSANVLLDPYAGIEGWRAKVSDYGSANFVRYAATAVPGNPLYGAPEANDPTKHSPKMDVFSFGVMLVEMVAGELPDNREELIRTHMHHWPDMVRMVRACTRHEPQRRLTMNELITDLRGLNVE